VLTLFPGNVPASRRDFFRVGALGLGGLTLADLLRLKAATPQAERTRDKAVIFVYLFGGPSHIDTYDMKPNAPAEVRGEFKPIKTNVPGFDICELMPMQAKIADKLALVRNLSFNPNFHDPVELFSGFRKPTEAGRAARPDLGCVVSRIRRDERRGLPPYIALDKTAGDEFRNGPAYLGQAHKAFIATNKLEGLTLPRSVSMERLDDRTRLMKQFDSIRRDLDNRHGDLTATDEFTAQALDMISGQKARAAFDISNEPVRIREKYGPDDATRLLQARRLVEAGVPVVTLTFGSRGGEMCKFSWDTHEDNFKCLRLMLPKLDQAIYALITDLHDRGLDKDVVVYIGGEMGRTPKLGQSTGNGAKPDGRDHWPRAGFGIFAGGGLQMGQVIGATDKHGALPVGLPYTPQNSLATIYRVLGFDPAMTFPDHTGRPIYLLDNRDRITELD
jgi:hypothetical protein